MTANERRRGCDTVRRPAGGVREGRTTTGDDKVTRTKVAIPGSQVEVRSCEDRISGMIMIRSRTNTERRRGQGEGVRGWAGSSKKREETCGVVLPHWRKRSKLGLLTEVLHNQDTTTPGSLGSGDNRTGDR